MTDGTFTPTGGFVAFPRIDLYALEHLSRYRVLHVVLRERRIDDTVIRKLLGWRHLGFSLHNAVRMGAQDSAGRHAVSAYVLRSPFSQEKPRYQAETGTFIHHPKMHPAWKRNFETFSACHRLAAVTAHIPTRASTSCGTTPCGAR